MKKITTKALLTLLLTICAVSFSVSNANNLSMGIDTMQNDTTCFAWYSYEILDTGQVAFTDNSWVNEAYGDTAISWNWTFGDGTTSTLKEPIHTFATNITKATVCLTVKTSQNLSCSVCREIQVRQDTTQTCIADFSYTSQNNGTVYFYNQSNVVVNAASWYWQFGDGTTSSQLNPVHTYAPGTKQAYVCLTVITATDSCTTCKLVYIKNTSDSCMADFVYERLDYLSTNPHYRFTDVSITDSPITWRMWTFSDSTLYADSTSYTDSTIIHSFASDLTSANVCLSISTSSGCTSSICKTINIADTIVPAYCKANFSYYIAEDSMSLSPLPRYRVNFYDLSYSTDSIIDWLWNFGDGIYSTLQNPSHLYGFAKDTTVMVSLLIKSSGYCFDTISQFIYIPANNPLYSMSGTVEGKNELLPQGIMVLYKKTDNGFFMLHDANIINNGLFSFSGLNAGKYILYAMPHMYLSEKYYPTYYVNKLHWANAQVIDLNSNVGGLTLKMVSTRILEKGVGTISGTVINKNETTQLKSAKLKSIMAGVSTPVYLYTPSGEVLDMSLTDESNSFSFEELPYGTYVIKIESLNLQDYATTITLSPETPEVSDVEFDLNNPVSVNNLYQSAKLTVRNVDESNIAVSINKGGEYRITVVSLSGKTVVNSTINLETNSDKVISLGSVPKGVYIMKLQGKSNSVVTKFLK